MIIRFFNGSVLKDHLIKEEEFWVCEGRVVPPQGHRSPQKAMIGERLAGSVASLVEGVRYLRACTGCSLEKAIEAASFKPAELLGISHQTRFSPCGSRCRFHSSRGTAQRPCVLCGGKVLF